MSILLALASTLPPALPAQAVIPAKEELRIDAEANDLLPIWYLFVSPKGVMVASQQQYRNFRFFGPDGRPLGTFGRNGEGPGEFRRIEGTRAGWIGDTLWLTEGPRITFVGPDRKLLRMERRPAELLDPRGVAGNAKALASPFVAGIAVDRSYQLMGMLLPNRPAPAWLTGSPNRGFLFFVQGRDGRFVRSIGWSPDATAECQRREERVAIWIPFCPQARYSEPLDRNRIVIAVPGQTSAGDGRFQLVALNATTGDTLLSREIRYRPMPIPARISDSIRAERRDDQQSPPAARALIAKVPFPEFYPPFSDLLTGRDGTIAIGLYGGPAGRKQWRFFDAAGKDLGVVEFPASVRLYAIERGRAWGTDGEPGDQDSIVRYSWRAGT